MTRYALIHEGKRILVVPDSKVGNARINCFYLGHIEGAYKLAKSIEEDTFGRPKSLRGTAARAKANAPD